MNVDLLSSQSDTSMDGSEASEDDNGMVGFSDTSEDESDTEDEMTSSDDEHGSEDSEEGKIPGPSRLFVSQMPFHETA